ncbi:hypothetical protein C4D60_Mb05t15670 [Musa balbisiana]|uniref:GST N-terminal domain-containing protein n=1 Tax=Musa balbisiana TaxID=52838 RepID=A0A4S8JWD9_MUSBA|nr:hypothetical protein C4D60_Mb05t15670 [Musa balbisiana]
MTLKVYADRMSQPSRAIIIFCKVNGIDFEEVRIDLVKRQHRSPEFEEINPMGQVPAIVDGRYKAFRTIGILLISSLEPKFSPYWIGTTPTYAVVQVVDEEDRDRVLGPHPKILQWIENVKSATSPHFEEVHAILHKVKARLHGRLANAKPNDTHLSMKPNPKL